MESIPNKEVSYLSTAGELVVDTAAQGSAPTLAVRRPNEESRPETSVRTLRSHSRGGRSSVCVQDPPGQAGSFPFHGESIVDRATRPNNPGSEPEMLPDRPLSTLVGMDPRPTPGEVTSSYPPPSLIPPDASDEASASFHSTPDFHSRPQTPSSHIYLEVPTNTASQYRDPESHTDPPEFHPVPHTGPDFYTCAVQQWRHRLTAFVKASDEHFKCS